MKIIIIQVNIFEVYGCEEKGRDSALEIVDLWKDIMINHMIVFID